jgi:purine-binding chemotaxis protein CheW
MTPGGHASRRKKKTAITQTEVCSVRLGEGLFGIPITHILEIVGGTRPLPVPLAPGFVGGLVHYRGDVLTTVSLRRLLDLPDREGAQDMLVVESAGGCYGLLVDSVSAVLTASSADFEANPSTINDRRRALFAGAYKLENGLMVMLDPERLDPLRLARAA